MVCADQEARPPVDRDEAGVANEGVSDWLRARRNAFSSRIARSSSSRLAASRSRLEHCCTARPSAGPGLLPLLLLLVMGITIAAAPSGDLVGRGVVERVCDFARAPISRLDMACSLSPVARSKLALADVSAAAAFHSATAASCASKMASKAGSETAIRLQEIDTTQCRRSGCRARASERASESQEGESKPGRERKADFKR